MKKILSTIFMVLGLLSFSMANAHSGHHHHHHGHHHHGYYCKWVPGHWHKNHVWHPGHKVCWKK